ncbi:MAG: DNA polymerase III subunit gamma/tau [Spirochaeta sp.]|jgi:DNA polymerase-3 subunit gamma/tau|nr:DNA polymerase III subunit gamma/tau [Spirochaeta sp.]
MNYEVTATRRRPRTFDELVGQEFVVATLKNSLSSGRIAHAYLFSGPRGVGKTSAARILAKALNCPDGPNADGCEEWDGSEEIARGTALDVIEIDGASNTSVNDVREIKDEVLFAPNSSRYKIYIIDEVHMLSNSAFNALLKTIEEPPPYIIFIFATTEIHKVPATIRSRCQQFNFRLIPMEEIRSMLAAVASDLGIAADEDALSWIAREATGSLRDAYTLFDQVVAFSHEEIRLDTIHEKLGLLGLERLNSLMEAVVAGRGDEALEIVDGAIQSGVPVERFTIDLADYLRTLLLAANGIDREAILGMNPARLPDQVRSGLNRYQLEQANEIVLQLYRDLRYSINQRFDLELAISRLVSLSGTVAPQALVKEIRDLQEELLHDAAHRSRDNGDGDAHTGDATGSVQSAVAAPAGAEVSPTSAAGETDVAPANGSENETEDEPVNFDEPPRTDGISFEQIQAIAGRFRTQRISVAALLARARYWRLDTETLVIAFADDFGASALTPDREAVQQAAIAELGVNTLSIRIVTLDEVDDVEAAGTNITRDEATTAADAHTEMVRKVFRGEIVEGEV